MLGGLFDIVKGPEKSTNMLSNAVEKSNNSPLGKTISNVMTAKDLIQGAVASSKPAPQAVKESAKVIATSAKNAPVNVAKGLYSSIAQPNEQQLKFEELAFPKTPYTSDTANRLYQSLIRPIETTITRPFSAGGAPIAKTSQEIKTANYLADEIRAGRAPLGSLDYIDVLKKTDAQIVGDVMQAVLTAYTGGSATKSLAAGAEKELSKQMLIDQAKRSIAEGVSVGAPFGLASALSSGTKDPEEYARSIVEGTVGIGALNFVTGTALPLTKEVKARADAALEKYKALTPAERQGGFVKNPLADLPPERKANVGGREIDITNADAVRFAESGRAPEMAVQIAKEKGIDVSAPEIIRQVQDELNATIKRHMDDGLIREVATPGKITYEVSPALKDQASGVFDSSAIIKNLERAEEARNTRVSRSQIDESFLNNNKISASEKSLLQSRLRAEREVASEVMKVARKDFAPKLKEQYGRGEVTGFFEGEKSGRKTGEKIGTFKTEQAFKADMTAAKIRAKREAQSPRLMRESITQFVRQHLPVEERGRFITAAAKTKTGGELKIAFTRAIKAAEQFKKLEAYSKEVGTRNQKIGFLKKIGEFSNTAIRDIKKQLDLEGPLQKMTPEQLDAVLDEVKQRFQFAKDNNLISGPTPRDQGVELKPEDYKKAGEVYADKTSKISFAKQGAKELAQGSRDFFRKIAEPLTSVMRRIDIDLKVALRDFERENGIKAVKRTEAIAPFAQKFSRIKDRAEQGEFAFALFNREKPVIDAYVKKYGLEGEYKAMTDVLKEIRDEGVKVGFDIGNLDDYFPRSVKDPKGLANYIYTKEGFSIFDEAFIKKETELKRPLTLEEKTEIVANIIRGFGMDSLITLSGARNFKARGIDLLDPEMMRFYNDPLSSLNSYIQSATDSIESRRFFGKGMNVSDPSVSIPDMIEAGIPQMIAEGKLKIGDEKKFMDAIRARFSHKEAMNPAIKFFKDTTYITTIGNFLSTITQFGDLGQTLYRAPKQTLPTFAKALFNRKALKFNMKDLGITKFGPEVTGQKGLGVTTEKIFRAALFTFIDETTKLTSVNAILSKYEGLAKKIPDVEQFILDHGDISAMKRGFRNDLMYRMRESFGTDTGKIAKALEALKKGEVTPETLQIAYNEVSDLQPISLSEMPEYYNKLPNGRVFWMLKSFTLKQFDLIRREALRPLATKGERLVGLYNLVKLTALIATAGATTDVIKNMILGRETKIDDLVFDNFLKLVPGLSKYTIYQAKNEGVPKALVGSFAPPMKVWEDISKDIVSIFSGKKTGIKAETLSDVPIVGKPLYWWYGKGEDKKKKKTSSSGGLTIKASDLGLTAKDLGLTADDLGLTAKDLGF